VSDFFREGVKSPLRPFAEFAFPQHNNAPPGGAERSLIARVACAVSLQLFAPALRVGLRDFVVSTPCMRMPETTVDENDDSFRRKYKIWTSGKIATVKPKSQPSFVKTAPHN